MTAKPKKKLQKEIKKKADIPIQFPKNKNILFFIYLGLAFLISYILYLLTLAPTTTLEDSGELIAAAYFLGVPHEPGYPLFAIFGKLFTLLPLGTIAHRVNIMSAFFDAAAAAVLFYAIVLFIEDTFIKTDFWKKRDEKTLRLIRYNIALAGALFWSLAYETWEQSVIAEVYGVNNFFICLFILLFLLWRRQDEPSLKKKYFYMVYLIIGVALTTHTTATMLIPIFGGYILVTQWKLLRDYKLLVKGFLCFLLGLTPFLYLPVASMQNPQVDWGNPENLTNFIRVITRHQYQFQGDVPQNTGAIFSFFFKELLPEQWHAIDLPLIGPISIYIILIPVGLYILFKNNKPLFYFVLFFLIMAIPVMSYMTRDFLGNEENEALVSIAYIPAYMALSIVMATGLFYLLTLIKAPGSVYIAGSALAIVFALSNIGKNYKKVDMHNYYFGEQYSDNIFNTLPKNSLLMINWDPFGFPLTYYQSVEKKRPDLIVLDELLLKRSWYIQMLRYHHPEFMQKSVAEVEGFLTAVAPFEDGQPYDGNIIQQKYIGMINALIDSKLKDGSQVFFTYYPEKEVLRNYHLEPQFSAYKYTDAVKLDSTIDDSKIKLNVFINPQYNRDRMANYMREYYGDLYGTRAALLEQAGKTEKAIEYFTKAIPFFDPKNKKVAYAQQRLISLRQNKKSGN
ncbi:MAG: DUF2723 domain-containing protein [Bacteroidia bacterium]|nr:DUF2723 domain-containing protein [Bacteroidia bacterium]